MDYNDITRKAKALLEDAGNQHVFVAVMNDKGEYRSVRVSGIDVSPVALFVGKLTRDPSHNVPTNLEELTSSGAYPSRYFERENGDDG